MESVKTLGKFDVLTNFPTESILPRCQNQMAFSLAQFFAQKMNLPFAHAFCGSYADHSECASLRSAVSCETLITQKLKKSAILRNLVPDDQSSSRDGKGIYSGKFCKCSLCLLLLKL